MKRVLCLLLAFACLTGVCLAAGGMVNFSRGREYEEGIFSDVSESDWFSEYVAGAYELGLMSGNDDGTFHAYDGWWSGRFACTNQQRDVNRTSHDYGGNADGTL